jgi:hypothetical protein
MKIEAQHSVVYLVWDTRTDEFDAMVRHVSTNVLSHLLIKATQQDGTHRNCNIVVESSKETGALQSNIRGSNYEGLARSIRQGEEIITGESKRALIK